MNVLVSDISEKPKRPPASAINDNIADEIEKTSKSDFQ